MTRLAFCALLAVGAVLTVLPVAAASHWTTYYDGTFDRGFGSSCWWLNATCIAGHMCTDGAPPQVVDAALHCVGRLGTTADDAIFWIPEAAWYQVDWGSDLAEESPSIVNGATAPQRDEVNGVLCTTVWSFFCANPIVLPEHVPIADPIGPYSLP